MSFTLYRTVLALHLIAVISWMAGILYLFRLFVYHAAESEAVVKARFVVMEGKLYRIILVPAMVVAFLLGVSMLAMNPVLLEKPWMHAKLFFALCLIGVSHMAGRIRRELSQGHCRYREKTFRILNEVPTLLMIAIVFLVILRPFG